MSRPSGLTVLRTLGPLATKKFSVDPLTGEVVKTPYGNAKWFSAQALEVRDIYDLSAKLLTLEGDSRACVVRGGLAEGVDAARMRRLLYSDGKDQPTLVRFAVGCDAQDVTVTVNSLGFSSDPAPVVYSISVGIIETLLASAT